MTCIHVLVSFSTYSLILLADVGNTKIKPSQLPGAILINDNTRWTDVIVHHFGISV